MDTAQSFCTEFFWHHIVNVQCFATWARPDFELVDFTAIPWTLDLGRPSCKILQYLNSVASNGFCQTWSLNTITLVAAVAFEPAPLKILCLGYPISWTGERLLTWLYILQCVLFFQFWHVGTLQSSASPACACGHIAVKCCRQYVLDLPDVKHLLFFLVRASAFVSLPDSDHFQMCFTACFIVGSFKSGRINVVWPSVSSKS